MKPAYLLATSAIATSLVSYCLPKVRAAPIDWRTRQSDIPTVSVVPSIDATSCSPSAYDAGFNPSFASNTSSAFTPGLAQDPMLIASGLNLTVQDSGTTMTGRDDPWSSAGSNTTRLSSWTPSERSNGEESSRSTVPPSSDGTVQPDSQDTIRRESNGTVPTSEGSWAASGVTSTYNPVDSRCSTTVCP